jgi:hypothetical protein
MTAGAEERIAEQVAAVLREGPSEFNSSERRKQLGHQLVQLIGIPRTWDSVPREFAHDVGIDKAAPTDGFTLHSSKDPDVQLIGLWRRPQ